MSKFLIFLSIVVYVECNGYTRPSLLRDDGYGKLQLRDDGYGRHQLRDEGYGRPQLRDDGYGKLQLRDEGYGRPQLYQQHYEPRVSYQPKINYQPAPQVVDVQNDDVPIKVIFRARSPKIQVEQHNEPGERGSVQKTRTEEEPHRVEHEVVRPVIQEIREIIQPYRRVIQEIKPVIEQLQTVVAQGDARTANLNNDGGQGGQALYISNDGNDGRGYSQVNDYSQVLAKLGLQTSDHL